MLAIVHSRLQSKQGGVPVEAVVHDFEWLGYWQDAVRNDRMLASKTAGE